MEIPILDHVNVPGLTVRKDAELLYKRAKFGAEACERRRVSAPTHLPKSAPLSDSMFPDLLAATGFTYR